MSGSAIVALIGGAMLFAAVLLPIIAAIRQQLGDAKEDKDAWTHR